jgi:hypothetical protein
VRIYLACVRLDRNVLPTSRTGDFSPWLCVLAFGLSPLLSREEFRAASSQDGGGLYAGLGRPTR